MAVGRPVNHVTREMAERHTTKPAICPDLTEVMVRWLEDQFPPRCLGTRETVEDHLRYAGKVDLVAGLRAQLDARHEGTDEALDPFVMPADLASR